MSRRDHAPIAVLGGAATPFTPEDHRSTPEMVLAAVTDALDDGALRWDAIDAVVTASVDLLDGLTASNIAVTEVVGAVMKPETRIAADGLAAALHACHQIAAEAYRTVLVVAHGKASMTPFWDLTAWALDPILLQPLGIDFLTIAGLQARLAAATDPLAERSWAELVASRRRAAGDLATWSAILSSPEVAAPIKSGMCAPLGDGACALVLSGAKAGARALITGTGHDLGPHYPKRSSLEAWAGLRRACRRAYEAAGITDPGREIAVAEPSCFFPHEEALFVSAAGLGEDAQLSPGGGLFAGTAPVVAGLGRLLEATRAVEGRRPSKAVAHGTWGPAGQGHAVAVVESP